jgi:hypothetical protein
MIVGDFKLQVTGQVPEVAFGDIFDLGSPWNRKMEYRGKHPNGYGFTFIQEDGTSIWFLHAELRKYTQAIHRPTPSGLVQVWPEVED